MHHSYKQITWLNQVDFLSGHAWVGIKKKNNNKTPKNQNKTKTPTKQATLDKYENL